ncbi:hypothetical protein B2G74_00225 [Burkholderia sp. A27]|nr:hypothetical protein B2G74_00225 [Burkholderia sp. A27]
MPGRTVGPRSIDKLSYPERIEEINQPVPIDRNARLEPVQDVIFNGTPSQVINLPVFIRGFAVRVRHGAKCWDLLVEIGCSPQKAPGGWFDSLNLPQSLVLYPDLDTLWQCQVFNRFHRWMREYF